MLSKDIFVPLTICIDQSRRALVIVLPCYGALEIVGVIIIKSNCQSDNYQVTLTATHNRLSILSKQVFSVVHTRRC